MYSSAANLIIQEEARRENVPPIFISADSSGKKVLMLCQMAGDPSGGSRSVILFVQEEARRENIPNIPPVLSQWLTQSLPFPFKTSWFAVLLLLSLGVS